MEYNVLNFGAAGDGVTVDTAAIQAAVDACSAAGGGRVVLPGGHTYRCGALILRSNLELHLEAGAVLKGSDRIEDYLMSGQQTGSPELRGVPSYINCEYTGAPNHYFLYAKDCDNLSITGLGTIDGNEEIFYGVVTEWHIDGAFYPRAPLLFLENISRLTIEQVTLTRSAFWTVHMVGCRDVLINGIRILNNLRLANCDGIDPDHCRNVRIANCYIECADDCIVFKNTAAAMQYGPCENITVSNCVLSSSSAAIKFGTESEALFRNIMVDNCVISRASRGISMQLRDKGSIENVSFQNLYISTRLLHGDFFWGDAEPIAITVCRRKEDTTVGTIRRIRFSNILCDGENGVLLYAEKPGDISDITFDRLSLHLQRVTDYPLGGCDLRPGIVNCPHRGLYYIRAHHADRVEFRGCDYSADPVMSAALTGASRCTDCTDLTL